MTNYLLHLIAAFAFGIIAGAYLEARLWRGKATTGFRMASGGKLYRITEE